MSEQVENVVNVADAPEEGELDGSGYGHTWRVLTQSMRQRGGSLGVNQVRLPPGKTACPFHYHLLEDEVFFVLSGRGMLRYGDALREIGPGDCIECPAGTRIAHQIANPFDQDLIYLAIGPDMPHEVCVYPDSGKVMVRGLSSVGYLEKTAYMAGEPEEPRIFQLIRERQGA